jgi:hypothetical protein
MYVCICVRRWRERLLRRVTRALRGILQLDVKSSAPADLPLLRELGANDALQRRMVRDVFGW